MNTFNGLPNWAVLAVFIYYTFFGVTLLTLFIDSRFSRTRTMVTAYGVCALLLVGLMLLAQRCGSENLLYFYTPCIHVPMMALFMYMSPERGGRTVFQFVSSVSLCFLVQQVVALFLILFGQSLWVMLFGYLISSAAVFWVVVRWLRPIFVQNLSNIRHGWWLMSAVLGVHYLTMIYLLPGISGLSSGRVTAIKMVTCLMMVGTYMVFLTLISSVNRELETRHNAQLADYQLQALLHRMDAVQQAENTVRIERHDMRHRLRTIAELIRYGQSEEALAFIGHAVARLESQKIVQWCRSPILDAVFSSYFYQAEQQGIRIEANIHMPEHLSVDESDLAVVFANSLENAINACLLLPQEERVIYCKCIGCPQLMFQISNPIHHAVSFDKDGLPLAAGKAHGLGTRSIAAFCKKYGAICEYEQQKNLFILRVIC